MDPASFELPFSSLLGIRILSAAADRVEAELPVRAELCTRPAVLHGGAVMALAALVTQTQMVLAPAP